MLAVITGLLSFYPWCNYEVFVKAHMARQNSPLCARNLFVVRVIIPSSAVTLLSVYWDAMLQWLLYIFSASQFCFTGWNIPIWVSEPLSWEKGRTWGTGSSPSPICHIVIVKGAIFHLLLGCWALQKNDFNLLYSLDTWYWWSLWVDSKAAETFLIKVR
jgi:hypothetical protein